MKTPPHTCCLAVARGSSQVEIIQQLFFSRAKKVTMILCIWVVLNEGSAQNGLQTKHSLPAVFIHPEISKWCLQFLIVEKNQKIFCAPGNATKFKFRYPQIKFYWNTATPTCLHMDCDWLQTTNAKLSNCS